MAYICTSAYILYHSRDTNFIDNNGKWQKLHIWKTHFWTMISTVTNDSQWMLVFKYIPQHLFIFCGVRHLTLMACLWHTFCSWNYTLLSYSDPEPFQLTGKHICVYNLLSIQKKLNLWNIHMHVNAYTWKEGGLHFFPSHILGYFSVYSENCSLQINHIYIKSYCLLSLQIWILIQLLLLCV